MFHPDSAPKGTSRQQRIPAYRVTAMSLLLLSMATWKNVEITASFAFSFEPRAAAAADYIGDCDRIRADLARADNLG